MNIKTNYLNAPIEEDVVFKQPESFDLLDQGKDFYETYSPTTGLSTISLLMCLAISYDYQ